MRLFRVQVAQALVLDLWPNLSTNTRWLPSLLPGSHSSVRLLSTGTMKPLRRPNAFDWLLVGSELLVIPCPESCLFLAPVPGRTRARHQIGLLFTRLPIVPRCPDKDVGGLPMFPGNPNVLLPCSSTPAGLGRLAFTALRCCPAFKTTKAPALRSISWLNDTASALAVYASCRHC